jgi:hypothetical protein
MSFMLNRLSPVVFAAVVLFSSGVAMADDDRPYGYQLMTPQERTEHREKMRSFKTEEEREQYRQEHHKQMQERARQQGMEIPDEPGPRGKGMGQGGGMGPGGPR